MGTKQLIAALRGEVRERPPFWFMRQAGRYLPEYREIRRQAPNFIEFCYNTDLAVEATLQPIRRFAPDAAIMFADILLVPEALGVATAFLEGEGPRLEPVRQLDQVQRLDVERIDEHLAPVYRTVARLARELPSEVALIGFAGAPWTVATYMVEGGGSKDFATVKRWALGQPDEFQELIDILVEATIRYLNSQIEAGAEVIQLFDTWAGALPEVGFRRWCLEPLTKIVQSLGEAHPEVPVIAFPRGCGALYGEVARESGVDGLGLDSSVPLGWAARELQSECVVQGNLDPQLLVVGGRQMEMETDRVLDALGGGPFIFNLGHGIVPETPPEHVEALAERVRAWRRA